MAAYSLIYDRAHNVDLQNRVEIAAVLAALQVSAEAANTENHANRIALAHQVLLNPVTWARTLAVGLFTDASAATVPVTDATLLSVVLAQWNAYAGTVAA